MKFVKPKVWGATEGSYSRASTATYTGADGLVHTAAVDELRIAYDYATGLCAGAVVEPADANLIGFSEDMRTTAEAGSGRPWGQFVDTDSEVLLATDTNPAGASGCARLQCTTTGAVQRQCSQAFDAAQNAFVDASVYVKAGEVQHLRLVVWTYDALAPYVRFDVLAGAIAATVADGAATIEAASIEVLAGGWYRCRVRANVRSGSNPAAIALQLGPAAGGGHYSGGIGDGLLLWGACVTACGASSYIPRPTMAAATRAADTFATAAPALAYCSAPENEYPAWSETGSYATGARVVHPPTHRVYESVIEGNYGYAPTDTTAWVEVGPTNRWAALDASTGTVSTGATGAPLVVAVTPGLVDSVCLLDCDAASASLTVANAAGATLYTGTVDLRQRAGGLTWFDWCFGQRTRKAGVVWSGLPLAADATVVVVLDAPTAPACGSLIAGRSTSLGDTNYGSQIGILSYSKKTTSEFGVTTVVPRAFAKRMTIPVTLANTDLDTISDALTAVRDTPVVWIGHAAYSSLVVYGFYKDWGIDVEYKNQSRCSLTIEGLT